MRKGVKGRTYYPGTAHLIVTLQSHVPKSSNKWHETGLYRNQRGEYFLAGEGGGLSRWGKMTPRGAIAGKGIEPISKDTALAYAKYAGLSLDKFARAGFEREEGRWLIDGQEIQKVG